ncbi:transposase [Sporomusa sphaeroides]|uniref:transposase n=1 Tax=Sporomusa sphaeroides TaxID=47679 RepID=UPI003CC9158C
MKNGQLKPGYNATIAVDAEYVVGAMISQERSDSQTFLPMLKKLKELGYTKPVADAGFESEENYTWCEENGQTAFIKPANYDMAKPANTKATSAAGRTCPTRRTPTATSVTGVVVSRRPMRKRPSPRQATPS